MRGRCIGKIYNASLWIGASLALLLVLAQVGEVQANSPLLLEEEPTPAARDDWGLSITPYAWFAAQSSDLAGQKLRQSFDDLASITELGFQCRLLARWRWLTFAADWTYADQKSATEIGRVSIDLELEQHILDMKLGGIVYDSRTPEEDGGIGVWLAAGARYWDNQVDTTLTVQPILPAGSETVVTESTGQTWWDPVLGLGLHFPVTPKVGFLVQATGGGLSIGDASDYMWDAEVAALFRLSRHFMLSAGYRQFKYDRTDDNIRQTVTVYGPFIGLTIGFF
jgi:hypothetical protein